MVDIEKIGKINISYEMGKTEIKNDLNRNDSLSEENTGVYHKLVDCLEKCLIYGHIRRFAN